MVVFRNPRGKRLPELIATDIAAAMYRARPLNMKAVTLPVDVIASYAGTYKDRENTEVVISLENEKLFYQKTGGPRWSLTPYGRDKKLFFDNTSTIGEMRRDARGRITAFTMQTLRGQSKNSITRLP